MKIVNIPKREEGQGLVEYALILVLVAIVVIIILTQLGSAIVLVFANVIGGFSGQTLTNSGHEGIVVSGNIGDPVGGGQCGLPDGDFLVVLVDDGEIITGSTQSIAFKFGGQAKLGTVDIGSSGLGTVTLSGLHTTCPATLSVHSW